jgi:glycosyltransferase involved in cell wall biosynthesis
LYNRSSKPLRLFYLGFAFPPGVAALNPGINPAGHAFETQMLAEIRDYFDIRSAGVLPVTPPPIASADPCSGVAHDVILLDRSPELFHRFRSLACLKAQYRRWKSEGWEPDVVMVYNLSPIYNQFLLWLRKDPNCPQLVLLLLDSPNLGVPQRRWKAFRRRFKPMYTPDSEMLPRFDACVGLSKMTERYFRPRQVPFLWMPGGCNPKRATVPSPQFPPRNGSLRLGYFGCLSEHAGVRPLVETVLGSEMSATVEICGYGRLDDKLSRVANQDPRLKFHGLQTPDDCLAFGQSCDVLVNPRPATHGNENNFASKLFDYALTGRAILTSRLSGAEDVLGPEAFYFDPQNFRSSLQESLLAVAASSRAELDRRGQAIQNQVTSEFSWNRQGARLASFLQGLCPTTPVPESRLAALAA